MRGCNVRDESNQKVCAGKYQDVLRFTTEQSPDWTLDFSLLLFVMYLVELF